MPTLFSTSRQVDLPSLKIQEIARPDSKIKKIKKACIPQNPKL